MFPTPSVYSSFSFPYKCLPHRIPPRGDNILLQGHRGAPRARSPIAKKIWLSIHQRKFAYNVSVRLPVCTDAEGGGSKSDVSPSGEEYVIAEVKFCISSTSLVSAVNLAARTLREEKTTTSTTTTTTKTSPFSTKF